MNLARIFTYSKSSLQIPVKVTKSCKCVTLARAAYRVRSGAADFYHDYARNNGTGPPGVLLGGVLGLFGLSKAQPTEEENLEMTVKMAILAIQEGNLVRADQLLHVALKLATDMQYHSAVTHIYCLMANLAIERGLVGQAERLFTEVLKRLMASGEAPDSNAVIEISLKLAQIFMTNGDKWKAEKGLEFSTDTMRKKVKSAGNDVDEDTLALFGMALDQYAQMLMADNKLREAELLFKEAVTVAKTVYGESGEQVLVVSNSLASVLSMLGDDKAAAQLLESVVKSAEELDTPHLTAFLVNLGLIRLKMGMVELARVNCERAKKKAGDIGDKETVVEAEQCLYELQNVTSSQNGK